MSNNLDKVENCEKQTYRLFVSKLPRHLNETDLRKLFQSYGRICELKVLKDGQTGESKGYCFLKYSTTDATLNALKDLNNKYIYDSSQPILTKLVGSNRKNRKIFIGMISYCIDEQALSKIFEKFGQIEDCKILRDSNGRSKCCAFITYFNSYSAAIAIKFMHQNFIMKYCTSPINVKYANNSKIKIDSGKDSSNCLLSFNELIHNLNSINVDFPKSSDTLDNKSNSFDDSFSNNCKYLFDKKYDFISFI